MYAARQGIMDATTVTPTYIFLLNVMPYSLCYCKYTALVSLIFPYIIHENALLTLLLHAIIPCFAAYIDVFNPRHTCAEVYYVLYRLLNNLPFESYDIKKLICK